MNSWKIITLVLGTFLSTITIHNKFLSGSLNSNNILLFSTCLKKVDFFLMDLTCIDYISKKDRFTLVSIF